MCKQQIEGRDRCVEAIGPQLEEFAAGEPLPRDSDGSAAEIGAANGPPRQRVRKHLGEHALAASEVESATGLRKIQLGDEAGDTAFLPCRPVLHVAAVIPFIVKTDRSEER